MGAHLHHNNPPTLLELCAEVSGELSAWLDNNPAIEDHDGARKAAELIKRGRLALQDLDAERDAQVRPLNSAVKKINSAYKAVTDPIDKIVGQIKARMTDYARAEEARRAAEAEAARLAALEAEKAAQEAARREHEAIENAAAGEIGAGVGAALQETAQAEADAARAALAAGIAEKNITMRVSTGFGRVMAMRTIETLVVENHVSAIMAMWPNAKLEDALLSAARAYQRVHGKLPRGIGITYERKM